MSESCKVVSVPCFSQHLVFTVQFCNQGKREISLCWVNVVHWLEYSFYLHNSLAHEIIIFSVKTLQNYLQKGNNYNL